MLSAKILIILILQETIFINHLNVHTILNGSNDTSREENLKLHKAVFLNSYVFFFLGGGVAKYWGYSIVSRSRISIFCYMASDAEKGTLMNKSIKLLTAKNFN